MNNKAKLFGTILFHLLRIFFFKTEEIFAMQEPEIAGQSAMFTSSTQSIEKDIRVSKLEKYLKKHHSPLTENAEDFVTIADSYDFGGNWAMVAAIAGVESTFGKHIPQNSHNAWGWGIPTDSQSGIGFETWNDGIREVSRGLKENYIDKGARTLSQIGRIYAPPSTTWAGNVSFFMREIESTNIEPELTL